ncbi:NhaA family Na+:H+ antiporter [Thermosporothrix hazakensis]|jgi:NhaA family Na+:H+ antiporter|uniref:Na(+)/H(+) antiporter NhaA n=1 Tax=Thermosporothrix hazakensis TaxID=644383 RepID=A0A326U421_THEHA|nr:Na+/H+ antiporter NhaA [Thermosporothrix hazakensis]PZW27409.1 NhaA family Na+:H+ antiporter [Thermosporothrix hazakensis]GCE45576.1 Na(+)/H(+) antiporter NhaA [Thermosporothrix hazakensis]
MSMRFRLRKPREHTLAERLLQPFQEFLQTKTSGGILLVGCTIIALLWANSPWASSYPRFWESHLSISLFGFVLDESLHTWINDGLMTFFFLLVGLEIKRELLVGELSSARQAVLPLLAALGGAIFPALIYTGWTLGTDALRGWGIPMATDIAFVLGILALLGNHIPQTLKIFLTALAIADDLLAVTVIAIFYTSNLSWVALGAAVLLFLFLVLINALGVRHWLTYALLGLLLWFAVFLSGVHATIAGVLLALTIPARSRIASTTFLRQSREVLDEFEQACAPGTGLYMDNRQQTAVQALETACERIQTPLQRIEHALNDPVSYVIVPLFVLANAGVNLNPGELGLSLFSPVSLGVVTGLVIGKQLGITLLSWLVVRLRWAELPEGVTFRHIYGVGWLAGIGFTMSLFIAELAFSSAYETLLKDAKVGILLALLLSGVIGYLLLRWLPGR